MAAKDIRVISIVPHRLLPLRNGGQQAIAKLHHYIGQLCNDDVITTTDSADSNFAFHLHKLLPQGRIRYLQYPGFSKVMQIAIENKSTHVICEHPYMIFTAIALSKKLGIPWFLRSHNIEFERYKSFGKFFWPALRLYERYAMQHADGIFFITPEDAQWAETNFKLPAAKCHNVPFGTDMQAIPPGHAQAKEQVAAQLSISKDIPWLYFLGALDYSPNETAVKYILDEIQPRIDKAGTAYEIIIAGDGLSPALQEQIKERKHIRYAGFVNDLDIFLKACDIMVNPVLKGGGVKTKAIEALGYNKTVISSASGAAGILQNVCGNKLQVIPDNDWDGFAKATTEAMNNTDNIPQQFYDTYYHGNIAKKVVAILENATH
jgi:hypothetical protein